MQAAELAARVPAGVGNLLADETELYLELKTKEDLAGLPQSLIDAFAEEAKSRKKEGVWIVANTRSSIDPFLTYSERRDLREKAWRLFVNRGDNGGPRDNKPFDYEALRKLYSGIWMVNNGYTKEMAVEAIKSGRADMVSFGRKIIVNPDLVRRFRENAPLNAPDKAAPLYGGEGAFGYTHYPSLDEVNA